MLNLNQNQIQAVARKVFKEVNSKVAAANRVRSVKVTAFINSKIKQYPILNNLPSNYQSYATAIIQQKFAKDIAKLGQQIYAPQIGDIIDDITIRGIDAKDVDTFMAKLIKDYTAKLK